MCVCKTLHLAKHLCCDFTSVLDKMADIRIKVYEINMEGWQSSAFKYSIHCPKIAVQCGMQCREINLTYKDSFKKCILFFKHSTIYKNTKQTWQHLVLALSLPLDASVV